jgi:phage shock protein A
MGIFQRIFKVAQAETHSVVDKFEDPIKMTEQGIRDLKNDLSAAMKSLAEVKAIAIRMRKDGEDQKKLAADYERKAMMLLQKAQQGGFDPAEADRLASEALVKKEESAKRAAEFLTNHKQQQQLSDQLQVKVEKLKQTVGKYENELITLKARARTAESMKKINKQMTQVDSSSTVAMLEKMKNKVTEEESLAEAYGELSDSAASVDEEIEKALADTPRASASDSLAAMKKKMGIAEGDSEKS